MAAPRCAPCNCSLRVRRCRRAPGAGHAAVATRAGGLPRTGQRPQRDHARAGGDQCGRRAHSRRQRRPPARGHRRGDGMDPPPISSTLPIKAMVRHARRRCRPRSPIPRAPLRATTYSRIDASPGCRRRRAAASFICRPCRHWLRVTPACRAWRWRRSCMACESPCAPPRKRAPICAKPAASCTEPKTASAMPAPAHRGTNDENRPQQRSRREPGRVAHGRRCRHARHREQRQRPAASMPGTPLAHAASPRPRRRAAWWWARMSRTAT